MFVDLWSELKAEVPSLSPFFAQKCVQRAFSDVRDADNWSWLEAQTVLQVPKAVTTGSVSWTQFTDKITGDATASAAWAPLLLATPPFICARNAAGQPLIGTGGYQLKCLDGPLYSVIASDNASPNMTLQLDRIIAEPSKSGVKYQAYRAYYGAPSSDWKSWISITNVQQGYPIVGNRLTGSQAQLAWIDPQDQSTEDPFMMFAAFADANGMPVKRLWPTPVTQAGYMAIYKRRGTDLSATVDLPASFPVNCLMERAKFYAAQFMSTQRRQPGDATDWMMAAKLHNQNYHGPEPGGDGLLATAKRADVALRTPLPVIRRGPGAYPFSGAFTASHDVTRILGAFPSLMAY